MSLWGVVDKWYCAQFGWLCSLKGSSVHKAFNISCRSSLQVLWTLYCEVNNSYGLLGQQFNAGHVFRARCTWELNSKSLAADFLKSAWVAFNSIESKLRALCFKKLFTLQELYASENRTEPKLSRYLLNCQTSQIVPFLQVTAPGSIIRRISQYSNS